MGPINGDTSIEATTTTELSVASPTPAKIPADKIMTTKSKVNSEFSVMLRI